MLRHRLIRLMNIATKSKMLVLSMVVKVMTGVELGVEVEKGPLGRTSLAILPIILAATFMQLLDVSIVNVAIPSIQSHLHASFGSVEAVVAGYQLSFAATLMTASRLGDVFGRRRLFLIGMAGFAIASGLCGAAPYVSVLVFGRVVQGFFSGLMFPQVLSIIQVTFPSSQRSKVFGIYGATIGLATIAGPLIGGLLIKANIANLDWRLIFYVNVPIGVAAFVGALFLLGESKSSTSSSVDSMGAFLITAGLVMALYPLIEGRASSWPNSMVAMLIGSVFVIGGFGVHQYLRYRHGNVTLVSIEAIRTRSLGVGLILFLIFFLGIAPFFFAFSIFLQEGNGFSPLAAGLTTAPFAIGSVLSSFLTTRTRSKDARILMLAGSLILAISMWLLIRLLYHVGAQLSGFKLIVPLFIAGIGVGLFVGPASSLVLARVPEEAIGSASGSLSTVQQIGGALGVALIAIIFFGFLGANANQAARAQLPPITAELTSLGLPAPLVKVGTNLFVTCIHDRATEKNPSALPHSCIEVGGAIQIAPIAPKEKKQLVSMFLNAAQNAAQGDFLVSLRDTLSFEIAVFVLTFLLTLALPGWPKENLDERAIVI